MNRTLWSEPVNQKCEIKQNNNTTIVTVVFLMVRSKSYDNAELNTFLDNSELLLPKILY